MEAVTALAVEPLLEIVEGRNLALAHHQQLAVEHDALGQRLDHIGKGARDIVAGARKEPLLAAVMRSLHADAVPFPFGDEVLRRDRLKLLVLDLMRQHQRPEGRPRAYFGPWAVPESQANSAP